MERENKKRVILVGMDGSRESIRALQWALRHLFTQQDSLIIIHAQSTASSKIKALAPYPQVYSGVMKNFEEDIKRSTEKICATAMKECEEKHVVPQTKAMTGDAKDVLCKAVKEYNADMLVLGSHGNGSFKRFFWGSVSDHCVHHAECPVVVVKNQKSRAR